MLNIGDFCIQDSCISKVTNYRMANNNIAVYCGYTTNWFIDRAHNSPLTLLEFVNVFTKKSEIGRNGYDNHEFTSEAKQLLREALFYCLKREGFNG